MYTSSGAAIGTLVAEFVVLVVQYTALKNEVTSIFKKIHYIKFFIALFLGSIASVWVKMFHLGNFVTLLISAILFFGVYGLFLLLSKEDLVVEIFNQVIGEFLKKEGVRNLKFHF